MIEFQYQNITSNNSTVHLDSCSQSDDSIASLDYDIIESSLDRDVTQEMHVSVDGYNDDELSYYSYNSIISNASTTESAKSFVETRGRESCLLKDTA